MFVKKLLALATAALLAIFLAPYLVCQESGRIPLKQHAMGSLVVIPTGGALYSNLYTYKVSAPSGMERIGSRVGIAFDRIEPATYTVLVEGASHRGAGTVTVEPGAQAVLNVRLSPIQSHTQLTRITVREAITREPVSGVGVRLAGNSLIYTDSEGGVTFTAVPHNTRTWIAVQRGKDEVARKALIVGTDSSASYEVLLGMNENLAVTNGLQAWYPMDANEPFRDAGPFGRHAKNASKRPAAAVDRFGVEGGAVRLDDQTPAIVIPDLGWQKKVPLSVSFWIKTDAKTESTAMFFGKYLHPSGDGWLVFYENRLLCAAHISSGFKHYTRVNTTTTVDEKWHHIVITITETNLVLYVDGARVPANVSDFKMMQVTTDEPIQIGRLRSTLWPQHTGLVGAMDDVAFYDRILTDEEILLLGLKAN